MGELCSANHTTEGGWVQSSFARDVASGFTVELFAVWRWCVLETGTQPTGAIAGIVDSEYRMLRLVQCHDALAAQ